MTLQPLLEASAAIQIHVCAALAAALLGTVILFRRKGTAAHRFAGRIWIVAMAVTALSSFAIHEIRLWGSWSPIHILSFVTLASLAIGVMFACRGDIIAHRITMQSTFYGALVIAGLFTLLPGRIMHDVLFGGDIGTMAAAIVRSWSAVLWLWTIPAALIALDWWLRRARRRPRAQLGRLTGSPPHGANEPLPFAAKSHYTACHDRRFWNLAFPYPKFLDRRPYRSRQVDARRPADSDDRRPRGPGDVGPAA